MLEGVRLTVLLGSTPPVPASKAVIEALQSVEISTKEGDRAGFEVTFQVGRSSAAGALDYPLLREPLLQPSSRVRLVVTLRGRPKVLFDGVITQHRLPTSSRAGGATFTVTGDDLGVLMDRDAVQSAHPGPTPEAVARQVLMRYAQHGIRAEVPDPTGASNRTPNDPRFVQQGTDYQFLKSLAEQYGYAFDVLPDPNGVGCVAYWGPRRPGPPAPHALSTNLSPVTNVDDLTFSFDALAPERPGGVVFASGTHRTVPVVGGPPSQAPLSREGAMAAVGSNARATAGHPSGLPPDEASARARGRAAASTDALTATGTVDVPRYGGVLEVRALVSVRGAGDLHDGRYRVTEVKHLLKRGQYRQQFKLARDGRGNTVPAVRP